MIIENLVITIDINMMQYGFIPGLGYLHIQAAKGKELPDRE